MAAPASHREAPDEPIADFIVDDALAEWNVPAKAWFAANAGRLREQNLKLDGIASGVVVFNPQGKVLIVQRASHDSMPNRWEVPGGAVDQADPTILHGAARELREEAGLVATRFRCLVAEEGAQGRAVMQVFPNRNRTRWFCRFAFLVDVQSCLHVRLDPEEHQEFLWATRDEIAQEKVGSREILVTHGDMKNLILESFRIRDDMESK